MILSIRHEHIHYPDAASTERLAEILSTLRRIQLDLTALKTAFSTFLTDFGTFATDVNAKLTALQANQTSPEDVQAIADITTGLNSLDQTVKAMDAALNPAPPAEQPTT